MGGTPANLVALTGSDQAARTTHGTYMGFALRETAASTAVVRLYDHASAASGTLVETISLAANESAREFYERGIRLSNGLYIDIVSGTVEGSVRFG